MGKPYMAATAVCVVIALALRSASVPKISGASWKDAETWLRQWPDVLVSPRAGLDVSSASLSGSTCNCKVIRLHDESLEQHSLPPPQHGCPRLT